MKILHVIAQLPTRTGSGVYFSNMIEEFKKYKHQQRAIFGTQGDYTWDVLEKEDTDPVFFNTPEVPFPIAGMSDVMPYPHTLYSRMDKAMMTSWKKAFTQRLLRAKEQFKPDIIFAHHLWILTALTREIFPDTPIIGICHNTDLRQAKMYPHLKEEHVQNLHQLERIFTASEEQKEEIIVLYGAERDKLIAVGGGFNQNIFYGAEKKEEDENIRLVFCAKIDPSKGIYELIDVYRSLGEKDLRLDVIGSPNEANQKRIEEAIKGDPTIRLYNVKDQVALGDELRKKDIFLMPSYYEGLGLMAIESLACGLYVVTTEIEALMSLLGKDIKDSGVITYVPLPRIRDVDKPLEEDLPAFKDQLREALLLQIEKVRRREPFPEKIKEKIQSFSWEGLVERMNTLIEKIH